MCLKKKKLLINQYLFDRFWQEKKRYKNVSIKLISASIHFDPTWALKNNEYKSYKSRFAFPSVHYIYVHGIFAKTDITFRDTHTFPSEFTMKLFS